MSTCTPIYGLPYTVGSDRPCDVDDTFCAFATAVEAQLDTLDALVNRTVDTVPMARVRKTVPNSVVIPALGNYSTSFAFDTVDVDTANMVDLTANPYQVLLPQPGIYHASFVARATAISVSDTFQIQISNSPVFDFYFSDSASFFMCASGTIAYAPTGTIGIDTSNPAITLNLFSSVAAQTLTFSYAALNLTWVRDMP